MKRYILTILLTIFTVSTFAQLQQAPKFASKAQKAIISVNTYDKQGNLMKSGTAFYIGPDGEAVSDYSLFKGAWKASVIDASGKQHEVDCILGADDTYSVVRFRVKVKGNAVLTPASYIQSIGSTVYALNYSKDKTSVCPRANIESLDSINEKYAYYKFSCDMGEQYVGGPVLNENGEVIGILHPATGKGNNIFSYALDIRFKEELVIAALQQRSATIALNSINIEKGLPDTLEESLVYAYFKSRTADNDEYLRLMNRFVDTYPQNAEGYYRRSVPLTDVFRFDEADADLKKYLSLADDKAVANINVAQAIFNKLHYLPEPAYDKWTTELAIQHIDKAIEMETAANRPEGAANTIKAKELKAQIYMFDQQYDKVIGIYEELNKGEQRSPAYYYAMSVAKERRGDSVSVIIADLDSAVAMFPTPLPSEAASFVLRRGQVKANAEMYRQAVIDYNQYVYLMNSKVSDTFYYDRSQIETNAHMYQQALDDINTAISMSPNNPLYHVEKGAMCLRVNMIDECIEACNTALRLRDDIITAYRIRGYAEIQKKDFNAARASLQKAIDMGDDAAAELMNTYIK